jgi:hypothetical protein
MTLLPAPGLADQLRVSHNGASSVNINRIHLQDISLESIGLSGNLLSKVRSVDENLPERLRQAYYLLLSGIQQIVATDRTDPDLVDRIERGRKALEDIWSMIRQSNDTDIEELGNRLVFAQELASIVIGAYSRPYVEDTARYLMHERPFNSLSGQATFRMALLNCWRNRILNMQIASHVDLTLRKDVLGQERERQVYLTRRKHCCDSLLCEIASINETFDRIDSNLQTAVETDFKAVKNPDRSYLTSDDLDFNLNGSIESQEWEGLREGFQREFPRDTLHNVLEVVTAFHDGCKGLDVSHAVPIAAKRVELEAALKRLRCAEYFYDIELWDVDGNKDGKLSKEDFARVDPLEMLKDLIAVRARP